MEASHIEKIKAFESNFLELDEITSIIDATFIDGKFFVLTPDGIFKIDLNIEGLASEKLSFDDTEDFDLFDFNNFTKISVYKDETTEDYYLLLTPKDFVDAAKNEVLPQILLFSSELKYQSKVAINFNFSATENEKLINFFAIKSSEDEQKINLVFIYNVHVCYLNPSKTELSGSSKTFSAGAIKTFKNELTQESESKKLLSVNILNIEESPYLLINSTETSEADDSTSGATTSELYSISISSSDEISNTNIENKYSFSAYSDDVLKNVTINFPVTNGNTLVYSCGQNIFKVNISKKEAEPFYGLDEEQIQNPTIEITDYNDTETKFIYSQTNKETYLLTQPWSSLNSMTSIKIDSEKDVIVIGEGKISINNLEEEESTGKITIQDYKYCIYTDNKGNHIGYIKTEDLTLKEEIINKNNPTDLRKYNKIMKVKPNRALYNFPTKVLGDRITSSISSNIIMLINENIPVELVDEIFYYTSNNSVFLKVKVNENVGFIEYDSLIFPGDSKDFVITNSSIKNDETAVYLEENANSTLVATLEKGKRVRINGKRNTKTGFTYITFNDEIGNEWSGYILNDSLKSDSWSTLQIIGFILIAINIGLLILIIYFRDTRIGHNGQKYDKSKKSN